MRLVLVTGGLGYIGSAFVPALAKRWPVRVYDTMMFGNSIANTPNVEFVQGDIRDKSKLAVALRGVTDVVHLAGIVTDELVDMNQRLAVQVNNDALAHLLSQCIFGVKRFIYASSSSIYGTQPEGVVATEETEPKPMTVYAETKLRGEEMVNACKGAFTVVSVRCATCCGPAPRMRLDTIVNAFCKQAWFDGAITVHGGNQWRTNVHIQDAVTFYMLLLDSPAQKVNGQVFNCSLDNHMAWELAECVRDKYIRFTFGDYQKDVSIIVDRAKIDPRHYRMSSKKACDILGWVARHSIADAIYDNFQWFKDGHVQEPIDPIYYNTRRMGEFMKEGT